MRSLQKALLFALLQPTEELKSLQNDGRLWELMYLTEEMKTMPLGDVWEEFLSREGLKNDYLEDVKSYEREVLYKR